MTLTVNQLWSQAAAAFQNNQFPEALALAESIKDRAAEMCAKVLAMLDTRE